MDRSCAHEWSRCAWTLRDPQKEHDYGESLETAAASGRGGTDAGARTCSIRTTDGRQHRRPHRRSAECAGPRRDGHGLERADRLQPLGGVRQRRLVSPVRAAHRHLRFESGSFRLLRPRAQEPDGERRSDADDRCDVAGGSGRGKRGRERHVAARRGQRLLCGRRRRRAEHREPAAQRPAVREPGGDDPGRWPRLPQRPDQEHAVLAADRRRQRAQRQLSDRRRRQQRRHRRRPPAALSARGDPGVQLSDRPLQGRVRPQQRRRDEHRHEERHEPVSGQLVHAVPRQLDERADGDREAQRRGQAGLPTLAVRRIVRRADRPEPGALLRGGGAHAARHEAEPSTRWDCFRTRTASSPRPSARTS